MEKAPTPKLTELQNKIAEKLAGQTSDINEYQSALESARQREEQAEADARIAYENMDTEAYHRALDEKRNSQDAAEMYEHRIDTVKASPCISRQEYEQLIDEITSATDEYLEAKQKEYAKMLEQIFKIKGDIADAIDLCNQLLSVTQKKLYKDDCGTYSANGVFIPMRWAEKRYKNTGILEAMDQIIRSSYNSDLLLEKHSEVELFGERVKSFIH